MTIIYTTGGGGSNDEYWISNQTTSGGAVNTTGATNMGAFAYAAQAAAPTVSRATVKDAGIRAGEIIAYRAWYLRPRLRLGSMYVGYTWMPKITEIAKGVHEHSVYGFYSYKTLEKARKEYGNSGSDGPTVYGEVALWGTVIEHERGYRAEFARIRRLYSVTTKSRLRDRLPRSLINKLRREYGV